MEGGDDGVDGRTCSNRAKLSTSSPIMSKTAMASIAASAEADRNAMRLREKELAAVKINPADVDIIANELELDKKVAERTLRENKGDAVAAVRYLLC
ncbi:Nascent polypeptide-associated complex subunit alpha-like, UBA domain [Dillenia turbinata]|uniref:Nascent polypeptide-associated complex subunit alpha-like, UBA domain n=1 Tax=Dillenia turbinata TaxID=194707 RepID=A0AAN8V9X7_9MAGN